ncbi:Malate-2H(+)/Na(+)-lactate antiporter [Planctomycetes bacterium Pla163]|uniref:Malate-2H(+)/Na(+)-lactate antiporter n=1 Tax=Rohdeia mirabilis TaxID=2528008 RepID=A0A518D0V4_9BACT|nr:Malate-2H(+)/Na(+)-lactate antiporter [Planctomycetes bacterium Pla163]
MSDATDPHLIQHQGGAPATEAPDGTPRWVPFLALLLVVLVALPWQGAPVERLGALEVAGLVAVERDSTGAPAGEDAEEALPSIGTLVLVSDFVTIDLTTDPEADPLPAVLRLSDIAMTIDGLEADADTLATARRSFVQGLRGAAEKGVVVGTKLDESGKVVDDVRKLSLTVDGESVPVTGGLDVRIRMGFGDGGGGRRIEVEPLLPGALDPGGASLVGTDWRPPNRFSLLPPILAIALAIATRRPLLSLFVGVLSGAILVALRQGLGFGSAVVSGAIDVPTHYFWSRFYSPNDLYIILFVVFMLAMVGNTVTNGGIAGIMQLLAKRAKDARTTQIATWLTGLAVFFDDYANTVLVGSTMRPLTDKFRVAREKLAYIVDSTAAPVAGISIFSTWIAFEVSTFSSQLPAAGMATTDGYEVFIQTLPYRYYCLFTLAFVALIAFSGRDFGPMAKAERRARRTGQVLRPGATPLVSKESTEQEMAAGVTPAAWRALVPLFGFIGTTLFMIAHGGHAFDVAWRELESFDAFVEAATGVLYLGSGNYPLMIGGAVGFVLAAIGTAQAGVPDQIPLAAWRTLKSMGIAFGILYSAWMVSDVCTDLGTAPFLTAIVSDAIPAPLLPVVLIVLAGFVAFATGSSWSTMGILLPMVVGVSFQLGETIDIGGMALMVLCIGAVLEGAIFGDHCSPISDTTVLSSISSASDHLDHVRTQAPYALTTMAVAIGVGYVPSAYLGWNPFVCIALGIGALAAIVLGIGRRSEPAT